MTITATSVDTLIRNTIDGLVDFQVENLKDDTNLKDVGLVSLDYVTIKVALRKKLGKEINLEELAASQVQTYGDFINYIVVH
jgi:acyl carrier protein